MVGGGRVWLGLYEDQPHGGLTLGFCQVPGLKSSLVFVASILQLSLPNSHGAIVFI